MPSVGELKKFLKQHNVDCSHCVEKAELERLVAETKAKLGTTSTQEEKGKAAVDPTDPDSKVTGIDHIDALRPEEIEKATRGMGAAEKDVYLKQLLQKSTAAAMADIEKGKHTMDPNRKKMADIFMKTMGSLPGMGMGSREPVPEFDLSKPAQAKQAIAFMFDHIESPGPCEQVQTQLNQALLRGSRPVVRAVSNGFGDVTVCNQMIELAKLLQQDVNKYTMTFVQVQHVVCAAIMMLAKQNVKLSQHCADVLFHLARAAPLEKRLDHLDRIQDNMGDDAVGGVMSAIATCLRYLHSPKSCEVFMRAGNQRGDVIRVLCAVMNSSVYSYVVKAHAASCFIQLLTCDGAQQIMLNEDGCKALVSACRSYKVYTGELSMGFGAMSLTPDQQRAQVVVLNDPHMIIPQLALRADPHNPAKAVVQDDAVFALAKLQAFESWSRHLLKPKVLWTIIVNSLRFFSTILSYLSRSSSNKLKKLGQTVTGQIPLEVLEHLAVVDLTKPRTCYMRTQGLIQSQRKESAALLANTLSIVLAWVRLDEENAVPSVCSSVPLLRLVARAADLDLTMATEFVRVASKIPKLMSALDQHVPSAVIKKFLGAEYDACLKSMHKSLPDAGKKVCSFPDCKGDAETKTDEKRKLKLCSRCRSAWYCSDVCQRAHWKAGHNKLCAIIGTKK